MSREYGRWFRFYDSVLDDPKVQRLTDPLFRAWVNLMCIANRNGGRIPQDFKDIAFSLRISDGKARDVVQALISAGLIDNTETDLEPHNWNERQFKSDVSTERVNRFRERKRSVSGNGAETLHETAPEQSRTETEKNRSEQRRSQAARGTRWPADKPVDTAWVIEAADIRKNAGLPPVNAQLEADKFVDFWTAKSGQNATKLDWHAAWRTWIRRAESRPSALPFEGGRMGPA